MEFRDIKLNIKNLQKMLYDAQNDTSSTDQHVRVKAITSDMENWYKIESDFYKEESRDKSMFDMDNNTGYFHTMVNKRLHTNNISALCDQNRNWLRDKNDIKMMLTNYFSVVSCTSNPDLPDHCFDIIPRIVTDADNVTFFAIPNEFEIENVVKNMHAWSSPGPDGFQNPKLPSEFRPIGLCNASYKIVSKILDNRIKPLLKRLTSPYQDAFVPGRDIHDNIIISHDMIHSMKHKEGLSGTMGIKLDLSKAFDRLEWSFLDKVLESFGFSKDFCNLIIQCVTTTSINVLINGSPCDQFVPTRGIRQGYPLSPYLFILAMKYLSRSLLAVEMKKDLTGIKVSRKAPPITHLLFADDILIFGQANMKDEKARRNFWWGHKSGEGIKFISWDSINVSKEMGGLGFRDLEIFNEALICKLVWKIITEQDLLWVQILSARCGTKINIWLDSWVIGLDHPPIPAEGLVNTNAYTYVSDIFHEANRILGMDVPAIGTDTLIWLPDRKGIFSVKSVYNVLFRQTNFNAGDTSVPSQVWKSLWKVITEFLVQLQNWSSPDFGRLKINIDVSFVKETFQGGIGPIIRDFEGTCLGVQGEYFNGGMEQGIKVEELESRAMKKVVTLAISRNLTNVTFESDSEMLVKSINGFDFCIHWMNQGLILDIRFMLNKISNWKCVSVKREPNSVANKIAKKARITKSNFGFLGSYPLDIQDWVTHDAHVISI
ncbi:uncharacterized protein LOC113294986 [Papaver somniferum]|uniref:uncharacterized protein LOC113294986 n=1 Tax=Papaver somniferum TaxID=3469 RepID=UPI000E701648|nr:uncharacterized protein LOC113294986 [Papaver somniferum]